MNKKVLGACIAVAVVSSGVGIAFAMKKSKLGGNSKCLGKKKKANEKVKIEGLNGSGIEISVEPSCFVTNVFITKKDGETRSCCSSSQ